VVLMKEGGRKNETLDYGQSEFRRLVGDFEGQIIEDQCRGEESLKI
jgi:hypothetical protein